MKEKKPKKKKIVLICSASVFLAFFLLLYGPYKGFSDVWILTAMHTSEHKYLAEIFYTDQYINKVLAENEVIIPDEKTSVDNKNTICNNDTISIINIEGNTFVGYIIKIENPARVSLVSADNDQGALLEEIVKKNNAIGGINASGYKELDFQGIADGISIINGVMVTSCDDTSHQVVGLNENNKLVIGKFTTEEVNNQNFTWAVDAGPLLIVNGNKIEMTSTAGGIAPRTAIGQTKEGAILLLVIDGRQISSVGASLYDVQHVLFENGAVDALNLDGGSSSSMVYEGELVNSPCRGEEQRNLPNAIIIH